LFHDGEGLPIGIQIVARFGDEATLVRFACDLEQATPAAQFVVNCEDGCKQHTYPLKQVVAISAVVAVIRVPDAGMFIIRLVVEKC
ncbi:hypothetical protein NKH10_32350, partial [Mesorhizobium sp. M1340]